MSPGSIWAALAVTSFLGSLSAAAQTVPERSMGREVPACAQATAEFPCRVPFDTPPTLLTTPTASSATGKVAEVWILVDESGKVRRAQIHRSAGVDVDMAAVDSAKHLLFRPAKLRDRPVASWIVLLVHVGAIRESCPGMGVPLSAGVAAFVDSTILERPELGTQYRFASEPELGLAEARFDVLIYPAAQWPAPPEQIATHLSALERQRASGELSEFRVLENRERKFDVRSSRVRKQLRAHILRVRLHPPSGDEVESVMGVFRDVDRYVGFRIIHPPSDHYRRAAYEFVRQVLSALASRPSHCR